MADESLFRADAVARKQRAAGAGAGDVLRLSPRWVDAAYRVVVGAAMVAVVLLLVTRIGEHTSGPAVVQLPGRRAVTAVSAGTVASVEAAPGDRVEAGQPLVVLHDGPEGAEVVRAEEQYRVALVEFLRDPGDDARRAEVARSRGERTTAAARAAAKVVPAPAAGVVSDVYAAPGQAVGPGDLVAAIRGEQAAPVVVALLPGRVRPLLHDGMRLRLHLPGFEQAPVDAEIVAVGGEVVGPAQARRLLGAEAEDAVDVSGPVVVVRARLREADIPQDGGLPWFHGMTGRATVRVRSEPALLALVPALEPLLGVLP